MTLILRIADGDDAIWAKSVLQTEEVAYVVLRLVSFRDILETWTSVAVNPAADKIKGQSCCHLP